MSSDYSAATGEVTLTTNAQILDKLRRLKFLKKDAKGEYYETTYGGDSSRGGMAAKSLKFYIGYAMRLPLIWANALTGSGPDSGDPRMVELEEPCPQCKTKGSLASGICFHCKGQRWIKTGEFKALFKLISTDDPTTFDTNDIPMKKIEEPKVDEAAAALA